MIAATYARETKNSSGGKYTRTPAPTLHPCPPPQAPLRKIGQNCGQLSFSCSRIFFPPPSFPSDDESSTRYSRWSPPPPPWRVLQLRTSPTRPVCGNSVAPEHVGGSCVCAIYARSGRALFFSRNKFTPPPPAQPSLRNFCLCPRFWLRGAPA